MLSQFLLFLKPDLQYWHLKLTPYQLSFTIFASFTTIYFSTFGILRGMNIFVDYRREGTEILLISKPLSRQQIFVSRILVNLSIAAFIGIINFILFLITITIMAKTSNIIYLTPLTTTMMLESSGYIFAATIFPYLLFSFLTSLLGQLLPSSRTTISLMNVSVFLLESFNLITTPNIISSISLMSDKNIINEKEFLDSLNKEIGTAKLMYQNKEIIRIGNNYDGSIIPDDNKEEWPSISIYNYGQNRNPGKAFTWSRFYITLKENDSQNSIIPFSSSSEFTPTQNSVKDSWMKLNEFISSSLANYLEQNYKPKYAFLNFVKFLNPFSALDTSEQSGYGSLMQPDLNNYQYTFKGFNKKVDQEKGVLNGSTRISFSVVPKQSIKVIPTLSVAITWIAYGSLISLGIYFSFRRRDFN